MACNFMDHGVIINATMIPCNGEVGSPNLVSGTIEYSSYGYLLTASSTDAFLGAFAALTFVHILLGIYWRNWYTLATFVLGGAGETVGWLGRYFSRTHVFWDINNGGIWTLDDGYSFIMQIVCLIISPVFFSAANYIILGHVLNQTGNHHTRLTAKSFATLFIVSDFICLVIQGAGGGIAGTATDSNTANQGAYIMTAGVILQLVVTVCFIAVWLEFTWRYYSASTVASQIDMVAKLPRWLGGRPRSFHVNGARQPRWRRMLNRSTSSTLNGDEKQLAVATNESVEHSQPPSGIDTPASSAPQLSTNQVTLYLSVLAVTTLLIVVRSVFRSVELLAGWRGPVETNQTMFIALDGSLMLAYIGIWAFIHPGFMDGNRLF